MLYLILILLISCNLDTKKSGLHKNSLSIAESKEKGVFAFQLKVDNPIINIGNSRTDTIKEIWVESAWMYSEDGSVKKEVGQQELILLGSLSNNYNDSIFLKHSSNYLGWNRVFFSSLQLPNDTIFVVKEKGNSKQILDTIIVSK